jgi:hypothetical protein
VRFLISLICLATPLAVLNYWASGLFCGFRISEKLPEKVKRALKLYGLLALLGGGAAVGTASMRGCISLPALQAYAASASAASGNSGAEVKTPKLHSLGKVTPAPPPFKVLTRMRMQEEMRKQKEEARQAMLTFLASIPQRWVMGQTRQARKGPFCHVTCSVHHGTLYDRETLPEFCKSNWIPPDAENVPGWWPIDDKHEFTAAWPGPAVTGFESYKLYWKEGPR